MIKSVLLDEKFETQKRLDEKANHNLEQYIRNAHQTVKEMAEKFGLDLHYGDSKGGFLSPIHGESKSTVE